MSKLDLKKCKVKFKDGYAPTLGSPIVSNVANYALGATTMIVSGFTGAVVDFDFFKVVGSTATHMITAHTETLSNTTSITFTPGLTGAVLDAAVITLQPHELEITVGEGNASWTEKHAREYTLDRGLLNEVRDGDQEPLELKLEMSWEFLRSPSGDPPTPIDALKQRGQAANWVSSDPDTCRPFSLDVEILYDPPCLDIENELYFFPGFRFEQLDFDMKAATISMTGKCNVIEPTVTRPT